MENITCFDFVGFCFNWNFHEKSLNANFPSYRKESGVSYTFVLVLPPQIGQCTHRDFILESMIHTSFLASQLCIECQALHIEAFHKFLVTQIGVSILQVL